MKKHRMYLKGLINTLEKYKENEKNRGELKKIVFYGVKVIVIRDKPSNYEEAINEFQMISALNDFIEKLTPREFLNIFPLEKYYQGDRFSDKDYFFAMEYMNTVNQDKPISDAVDFLWYCTNENIHKFNVETMMNLSYLRQMEGRPSLAKEWADINEIPTYTQHTDHEGNEFLLDDYGKTQKVIKPRPKHLTLVK